MDESFVLKSLINWNVLSEVEKELVNKIKYFKGFQVYTNEGGSQHKSSALFLTSNDDLYAVGYNNEDNILALTGENYAKSVLLEKPQKIEELSGKNIKKICIGERFAAALTNEGKVKYWGVGMKHLRFNERRKEYVTLPYEPRPEMKVIDMAPGARFMIFVTINNDVVLWGCADDNYCKIYDFEKINIRRTAMIRAISSGRYHAALLDQKGQVWSFGNGLLGQLGHKWIGGIVVLKADKVPLPEQCIKVECGANSTLFLLRNGDVYACGSNSRSDHLCVGQDGRIFKPLKVLFNNSIDDIVATYHWQSPRWQSVFTAHSKDNNKYFKWGDNPEMDNPQLVQTANGLEDLFVNLKTPESLGLMMKKNHDKPLNESDFFDNPLFSDVAIKLVDGSLYGHKAILHRNSEFFRKALFSEDGSVLNLQSFNPSVMKILLW